MMRRPAGNGFQIAMRMMSLQSHAAGQPLGTPGAGYDVTFSADNGTKFSVSRNRRTGKTQIALIRDDGTKEVGVALD